VIHGIVDSLWLRKHGADSSEFHGLCAAIREELGLPISFEGRSRWVAFPPSRMHAGIPVLNRYYGVFEDGRIKARGIELQRHDTPKLVKDFQTEMLQFLAKAHNTQTLRGLAPRTENIIARYLRRISSRDLTAEDLAIQKSLSKDPDAYAHKVLPSIAAQQLVEEGAHISAGHQVRYVITDADNRSPTLRATAIELAHTPLPYDAAKYSELLISSANTLLQPLGYTVERSTLTVQLDPSRRLHP